MSLLSPKILVANLVALHAVFFLVQSTKDDPPAEAAAAASASPSPALRPSEDAAPAVPPGVQAAEEFAPPPTRPGALRLQALYEEEGKLFANLGQEWVGELTTDLDFQNAATRILNRGRVPFGAVVVLDVKTGNVLAMADRYDERHEAAPKLSPDGPPHLALRAVAPAASVFKVITSAALLELGVSPTREYPFAGARRRLHLKHLEKLGKGAPRTDMGEALADSNNGFFARMADRKLAREDLQAISRRFGFNQVVPFPLKTEASTARVPRNRLERARMAAGFWHTRLTPLHGALIAAAVAGDGSLPRPRLVGRLHSPDGRIIEAPEQAPFATAMTPKQAKAVRRMMAKTPRSGTLRRAWRKWPKSLRHIAVGGKTGSLAKRTPYTYYTWFVGFAPVDKPEIAVAVMVGNGELWWQRAADIGRDVMAWHFKRKLKAAKAAKAAVGGKKARRKR